MLLNSRRFDALALAMERRRNNEGRVLDAAAKSGRMGGRACMWFGVRERVCVCV